MNNLDLSVRYRERLPKTAAHDYPSFATSGAWAEHLTESWSKIEDLAKDLNWDAFLLPLPLLKEMSERLLGFECLAYGVHVEDLKLTDYKTVLEKDKDYGASWKRRGGVGALMMLCRKWDRISNFISKSSDFLQEAKSDNRAEGVRDDIADLRRYLLLVRSEIAFRLPHNKRDKPKSGKCGLCGVFRKHLDRDHIIPRWKGGGESPENIQYICQNCHKDKSCEDVRGYKFSEESRAKMRASSRKFWDSPKSESARLRIANATKSRVSPLKGKKASAETREKLRISHLGKKHTPQAKAKIVAALKNNKNLQAYYKRGSKKNKPAVNFDIYIPESEHSST